MIEILQHVEKSFNLHHALMLTYDVFYEVILLFFANFTPIPGVVVQFCTTRRIFNFTHRNFFSGATIICDF